MEERRIIQDESLSLSDFRDAWAEACKKQFGLTPEKFDIVDYGIDEETGVYCAAIDALFWDDDDILDASFVAFFDGNISRVTWMRGVEGRLSLEPRGALDLFRQWLPIEQLAL